jgi:hypothetical protein
MCTCPQAIALRTVGALLNGFLAVRDSKSKFEWLVKGNKIVKVLFL